MRLSLSVTGAQADRLGQGASVQWVDRGGTIGRADNNDWTLPDPQQVISRCHARIRFAGGRFYLEDASANGIFIDQPDNRMNSREMYVLEDGQRLFLGDYEIAVGVDEGTGADDRPAAGTSMSESTEPEDAEAPPDPLDLLGGSVETPAEPAAEPEHPEPGYLQEHFTPAPVKASPEPSEPAPQALAESPGGAGAGPIPDDWWRDIGTDPDPAGPGNDAAAPDEPSHGRSGDEAPASSSAPEEPPAADSEAGAGISLQSLPGQDAAGDMGPMPEEPAAPGGAAAERPRPGSGRRALSGGETPSLGQDPERGFSDDALRQLLEGAGIDPSELSAETAETLGRVLHVAVDGLMDLLRARTEVKNEFRMSVTLIQATDNNPLKFSTNVADALHNLLVKNNPDYLGPEDAFRASFDDLRFHQMAMLAGMREAFFATIERFDPDSLEALFAKRHEDRSLVGRMARRRYWEQYRELYDDIRQDTEGYFNRLFGEAFVDAYERQMEELKNRARGKG